MITYSINWMGPLNKEWIEENGANWCAGRIDIRGVDDPYGLEYAIYPISRNSWHHLGIWLRNLQTEELLSKEELFSRFEEETGEVILTLEEYKKVNKI